MSPKRLLSWFGLLVLIGIGVWQTSVGTRGRSMDSYASAIQRTTSIVATSTVAASVTTTNATVVRAVDGDTIKAVLDGERDEITVRLLGVNTPESVDPRRPVQCFGKEASAYAEARLAGHRVRLDPDFEADNIDKYGRLLRNVVLEDGTDFNAQLVREGYAYAYVSFPLQKRRKAQLRLLQAEAEQAQRGLWNAETCNGKK